MFGSSFALLFSSTIYYDMKNPTLSSLSLSSSLSIYIYIYIYIHIRASLLFEAGSCNKMISICFKLKVKIKTLGLNKMKGGSYIKHFSAA